MKQKILTKEEYTAGMDILDAEKIEHYGKRIVSSDVASSILSKRAGKNLNRNTIIQMCRTGRIHPMGIYKHTFYFWRHDVEHAKIREPKLA